MKEELAVTLGLRIRRYRLQSGHSQERMARAVNLPPQVVSRMERGKLLPTPGLLVELCEAFGLSADTLLGLSRANN